MEDEGEDEGKVQGIQVGCPMKSLKEVEEEYKTKEKRLSISGWQMMLPKEDKED